MAELSNATRETETAPLKSMLGHLGQPPCLAWPLYAPLIHVGLSMQRGTFQNASSQRLKLTAKGDSTKLQARAHELKHAPKVNTTNHHLNNHAKFTRTVGATGLRARTPSSHLLSPVRRPATASASVVEGTDAGNSSSLRVSAQASILLPATLGAVTPPGVTDT